MTAILQKRQSWKLSSINGLLVQLKLRAPEKSYKTGSLSTATSNTDTQSAVDDSTNPPVKDGSAKPADKNADSLVSLAEKALELAKKLQSSVKEPPTFQNDTLANIPAEAENIRLQLLDVSNDLNSLTRGSVGCFGRVHEVACVHFAEQMSLHFIYRFKVHQAVPLDGKISYTDLSKKLNVDEASLTRLLRNAMTFNMFHEPTIGYLAHTPDSRLLVTDPTLADFIGCCLEDLRLAAYYQPEALEKWPGSQEPNEVGFNVAWNTELPCYRYLSQFPARIQRVSAMMVQVSQSGSGVRDAKRIANLYPWQTLGAGTVVDVGGGNGQVSIALAREHQALSFVVQDLPHVCAQGQELLPEDVKGRVAFMPHDVFKPNPVKDAAVFYFMNMIHTWSDKYVVQIFQQILPSLQPGARLLVCDRAVPEPGEVTKAEYKEILSTDMYMMANVNGRERSVGDILNLFRLTSDKLVEFKVHRLPESLFAICEAVWKPRA